MEFTLDANIGVTNVLDGSICINDSFECECSLGTTLDGEYGVFYTIHDTDTPINYGA